MGKKVNREQRQVIKNMVINPLCSVLEEQHIWRSSLHSCEGFICKTMHKSGTFLPELEGDSFPSPGLVTLAGHWEFQAQEHIPAWIQGQDIIPSTAQGCQPTTKAQPGVAWTVLCELPSLGLRGLQELSGINRNNKPKGMLALRLGLPKFTPSAVSTCFSPASKKYWD